jgi:hypothetical protein
MNSPKTFPRLVKGALVTVDSSLSTVTNTITFQYNPVTLTRTLQAQAIDGQGQARAESLRLQGAPIETIKLDVEFETTGPLSAAQEKNAATLGLYPQLSALETLIYPTTEQIKQNMQKATQGTIEIIPTQAPMTLFVWGNKRIIPVRLTDFSITEETYDANLNPAVVKVSLSLRVLSYNDLPWEKGGKQLFFPHHQEKEKLAEKAKETGGVSLNLSKT